MFTPIIKKDGGEIFIRIEDDGNIVRQYAQRVGTRQLPGTGVNIFKRLITGKTAESQELKFESDRPWWLLESHGWVGDQLLVACPMKIREKSDRPLILLYTECANCPFHKEIFNPGNVTILDKAAKEARAGTQAFSDISTDDLTSFRIVICAYPESAEPPAETEGK